MNTKSLLVFLGFIVAYMLAQTCIFMQGGQIRALQERIAAFRCECSCPKVDATSAKAALQDHLPEPVVVVSAPEVEE